MGEYATSSRHGNPRGTAKTMRDVWLAALRLTVQRPSQRQGWILSKVFGMPNVGMVTLPAGWAVEARS